MTRARFSELVEQAVAELPQPVRDRLHSFVILVEDEPSGELLRQMGMAEARDTLFGYFEGTPLPERGSGAGELPGRIVIYYRPIVRTHRTPWAIRREVRKTVIHEVAHALGFDEDEVARAGYA